ncbi:MAG: bifunctional DNA-formamidopyrimidine glycosylase/DNA-(apurinic or apyrimidinic site) lyase [Gemmataceae bacterium]
MPELPEVETVVRELRPHLVGRRLGAVTVGPHSLRRGWSEEWATLLPGRRVKAVRRRGKWIIIETDRGPLLVHLGMSGQFVAVPAERPLRPHTHLVVELARGIQLRFRDPRRFGSVTPFSDIDTVNAFLEERLGPEPFDLKPKPWRESLAKSRRPVKAFLLDQTAVAGVGNIYADEALFAAKVYPGKLTNELTPAEAERLRKALPKVLNHAIERRGSSIRDYVGGGGRRGKMQKAFQVYGRTGKPCPRCGTPIARIRLAGRSTHFCPKCQAARRVSVRGQR